MIDVREALRNQVTFITGSRKGAGKTTFLNYALRQLRQEVPVTFLTIGVDGEMPDSSSGQAKPRVLTREGDTLLTCQTALARTDGLCEIRHVFPYRTVLGRSVLVRMIRGGFVELVGPEDNRQLTAVIRHVQDHEGIRTILVDGAVNRLTPVSSIPQAGYVYVTRAERHGLEKTVREMRRVLALDEIPLWTESVDKTCYRLPGALTESRLQSLPEGCEQFLVQDFTKVFLSNRQLAKLRSKATLFFQDILPLRFFVVNLFELDREELLARFADDSISEKVLFNPYEDAA